MFTYNKNPTLPLGLKFFYSESLLTASLRMVLRVLGGLSAASMPCRHYYSNFSL